MFDPDDLDDAENVCALQTQLTAEGLAANISSIRRAASDADATPGQVRLAVAMDQHLALVGVLTANSRGEQLDAAGF